MRSCALASVKSDVSIAASRSAGGGSTTSGAALRSIDASRTCAYCRYGPVSPSNESMRFQSKL